VLTGLLTSCFCGDDDDLLELFTVQDTERDIGALVTLKCVSGFGNTYWCLVVDYEPQVYFYMSEDQTKRIDVIYDPNFTNHTVTAVCLGAWSEAPADIDVTVSQQIFLSGKGTYRFIEFTQPFECFSSNNSSQFSNWNLTGLQRYLTGYLDESFPTRHTTDIELTTEGAVHTLSLKVNDITIALGSVTGNGTITLTPAEDYQVSGTVTLNYVRDLEVGEEHLITRWPKSYKVYINSTLAATIDEVSLAQKVSARIGPLDSGSNTISVSYTSDTGVESNSAFTGIVAGAARPSPPTLPFSYVSGNYSNTVVKFGSSISSGVTYNFYDSPINGAPNMLSAATTFSGSAGPYIQKQLPSLGTPEAGFRTVVINSVYNGVEDGFNRSIRLEYDSAGTYIYPRPNIPTFTFKDITSGNRFYFDWSYDAVNQYDAPSRMNLWLVSSGTSPNYSSPTSYTGVQGTEYVKGGVISGIAPQTHGSINYILRASTLSGSFSENTTLYGPIFISSGIPSWSQTIQSLDLI